MKYFLPVFAFCMFLSVCAFSQTETVFYPLKTDAHDSSGNNNNGRLVAGAKIDNYLIIPYNAESLLKVPPKVINGLMHYEIDFEVYFDSLHIGGANPRNTILNGNYQCGDSRVDIYYNEVGAPVKSWVVMLEGEKYVFHDKELLAQEWDRLRIVKRFDSVKMFRNARLLGSYEDKSDSLTILGLQIGQQQSCLGPDTPMCMDGRLRNFKVINYDKTTAGNLSDDAFQQGSVKSATASINIYPNPSNGIITIPANRSMANLDQQRNIKVYNSQGILVKEISNAFTKNSMTLDLSNMPAGIYFIRTESGNVAATGKVVIR